MKQKKQFIEAKTLKGFQTALSLGKVSENQIGFIEKENLIWTRGQYYGNNIELNEEDINKNSEGKLQFADRPYDEANFSGKGYKILRKNIQNGKNILTQEMINKPNTVYEIRYDFDLNGTKINIPEGCTLKFDGGSFNNGTITGNNTSIYYNAIYQCFNVIVLKGTFNTSCIYIEQFSSIQEAFDTCGRLCIQLRLLPKRYVIEESIILREGYSYNFCGSVPTLNAYSKSLEKCSSMLSKSLNLFISEKNTELIQVSAIIKGIHFAYHTIDEAGVSTLFKNIAFGFSVIENNSTLNFGTIFCGTIESTTKVRYNNFEGISKYFCDYNGDYANLNDCNISYNYINGKPESNATCFNCNYMDYVCIDNNFIDFFKYVFASKKTSSIRCLRVNNNIFDYCFSIAKAHTPFLTVIFNNNVYSKFSKDYISSFPNADEDMVGADNWTVFKDSLFKDCIINNSLVENCDKFVDIYDYNGAGIATNLPQNINTFIVKIYNTTIDNFKDSVNQNKMIEISLHDIDTNYTTFYVDSFDYITLDSLPEPLDKSLIHYFNFQHVLVNGEEYMYLNKKWIRKNSNYNDILNTGTFVQKPISPNIGFAYFCTDKQSPESTQPGLMIYHKGNNVWIDSMNRIVDDNYPKQTKIFVSKEEVSNAINNDLFRSSHNIVTSLSNVPTDKFLVIAEIQTAINQSFSLSGNTLEAGKEIHVIIHNNSGSKITVTIPDNLPYINCNGESILSILENSYAEINIISIGDKLYVRTI